MDDDFTSVSTRRGFVYVAFVIDTFANSIVALHDLHANSFLVTAGRRHGLPRPTSFSPLGRFALQIASRETDALEQALYARRPGQQSGLIHHRYRGGQ